MEKYYVAYGSNLNMEEMKERCPDARVVGTGVLEDYCLGYRGTERGCYLTVEQKSGAYVPVVVWRVSSSDEEALDEYECYPELYYKKDMSVDVTLKNGNRSMLYAFIYIMYERFPKGMPSLEYLERCKEGYRQFGFDTQLLIQTD